MAGKRATHVLLVEDEKSDAHLLIRACQKQGVAFQVERVSDGEQAIAFLKNCEGDEPQLAPGLMLLDLKLPRCSGFEVLEWLRGRPSPMRRLPVIVLSSSGEPKDINRAYDLGANSYLTKPHDPRDIATWRQHSADIGSRRTTTQSSTRSRAPKHEALRHDEMVAGHPVA